MNFTALDATYMNKTTAIIARDSFPAAFVKNFIVVSIWLGLSYINCTVIVTFFKHQMFYQDPRYILFIHMVISDAIQLTVTIIIFILSYVLYTINVSVCCFFILMAIFTTRNTPINLSGMALERYIAVCKPLHHSQICTIRRTYILIGFIWFLCITPDTADLFITLSNEPVSFFYTSVFCLRQNIFKDPRQTYRRQAFDTLYFSFVSFTLVYTYLRIMRTAEALSTQKVLAQKARRTILLHGLQLLMCILSYVSSSIELAISQIFPGYASDIRYATYLIVFILPRFLSPIIYGIRDKKFYQYLKRDFICNVYQVRPTNIMHTVNV